MNAFFAQSPVFADIGDWFKLIVPAIFVIFWVISQLSGGNEKGRRPPNRGRGAPPRPPNDGNIRGEIDDFLRRVKEQAGISDENDDEDDWDEEPEFAQSKPAPVQQARVLEAEVIEPPMSAGLPSSVRASDGTHSGDRIVRQSLGAAVGSADEKMETHRHEVFDHEVGGLSRSPGDQGSDASEGPVAVPATADEIRHMLSGPAGVRNAIVMSEILNRPSDRW